MARNQSVSGERYLSFQILLGIDPSWRLASSDAVGRGGILMGLQPVVSGPRVDSHGNAVGQG